MAIGIVSAQDLVAERSGRFAGLVIIDARRKTAFLEGHIPGALSMVWESWCEAAPHDAGPILVQEGYWGVVAPIAPVACGERLASLGLRDDRPILVYADGPRTRGREGRIAWMLLYFGAHDVLLLDGGWSAWIAAGGAVQAGEACPATAGHMTVRLQQRRRRTLAELKAAHDEGELPMLIDTRSQVEFAGVNQAYLPRRGHLPCAQLQPFTSLFDADGRYVARERYMSTVSPDIQVARNMVAYCEVGVRASLFALLHEVYTGLIVPVYDGSLMEWSLQHDLPMERSANLQPLNSRSGYGLGAKQQAGEGFCVHQSRGHLGRCNRLLGVPHFG